MTDLQEGKPLLQLLHREHLDTNEAHTLNNGNDGSRAMGWVPNLQEEPAPDRMEPGLTQYTYHLSIEISNLPHIGHIGVGVCAVCEGVTVTAPSCLHACNQWEYKPTITCEHIHRHASVATAVYTCAHQLYTCTCTCSCIPCLVHVQCTCIHAHSVGLYIKVQYTCTLYTYAHSVGLYIKGVHRWSLMDSCCLKCLKARSSILWMKDSGTGCTERRGMTSTSTRQKRNSTTSSLRSTRWPISLLPEGNGESVTSLRGQGGHHNCHIHSPNVSTYPLETLAQLLLFLHCSNYDRVQEKQSRLADGVVHM